METQEGLPTNGGQMSVTEVTGLVQLFNNQLLAMEGRLAAKMDENSRAAAERWARHDQELEANTKRIVARFEKLEAAILVVEKTLEAHLDREHEEDLITEARVKPVKTVFGWLWSHWRDLLLLFIGLVAAGTFFLDWVTHMVEGFTP